MLYVVVGGGIAGVSCAEELSRLCADSVIHLVSESPLIKAVTNFTKVSQVLEKFDVSEQPLSYISQLCPNVTVHQAKLLSIDVNCRTAELSDGSVLKYDRLCLCTGAKPSLIEADNPLVLGLRDVESAREFQKKLRDARRIVVVGNGGIATEIVYEVGGCEVVWAIKDHSIGHTFFDEGAAVFFLPHLVSETSAGVGSGTVGGEVGGGLRGDEAAVGETEGKLTEVSPLKRLRYALDKRPGASAQREGRGKEMTGGALGPDWHSDLKMAGKAFNAKSRHVHVEYNCEVEKILRHEEFAALGRLATQFPKTKGVDVTSCQLTRSDVTSCQEDRDWALYVMLTNGTVFGCDLVVSATGVTPSAGDIVVKGGGAGLALAGDGGVKVDRKMSTNIPCVYAAGDVCTTQWDNHSNLWFQMRLWTQARQMGSYAAQCIASHSRGEELMLDFCFEMFSHTTTFFGYKVVLLGLFNAQGLGNDYQMQLRCTKGLEYVKVIVQNGRVMGAVLIGETGLEETFENLILNQMDISQFDLLDPRVDLEDYFD